MQTGNSMALMLDSKESGPSDSGDPLGRSITKDMIF